MIRGRVRLGILVPVVLALLVVPELDALARSPSRDFPRCVQACNEQRRQCREQAWLACAAGLGAGSNLVETAACIVEQMHECEAASRACKVSCVPLPAKPEP